MREKLSELSDIGVAVIMVVLLAMGKPPSVRGSVAMAIMVWLILELLPRLGRIAVGASAHLRYAIVAILMGVAYYVLPRL